MDANGIANKARRSISKFCIEECKALCCRKGHLALTRKEADSMTRGKIGEYSALGLIVKIDEQSFAIDLGKHCPFLKDHKCIVHNKTNRSKMCKDFPIFLDDKNVTFSMGCPAVLGKLFYPYEKKLLKLGYNLNYKNFVK